MTRCATSSLPRPRAACCACPVPAFGQSRARCEHQCYCAARDVTRERGGGHRGNALEDPTRCEAPPPARAPAPRCPAEEGSLDRDGQSRLARRRGRTAPPRQRPEQPGRDAREALRARAPTPLGSLKSCARRRRKSSASPTVFGPERFDGRQLLYLSTADAGLETDIRTLVRVGPSALLAALIGGSAPHARLGRRGLAPAAHRWRMSSSAPRCPPPASASRSACARRDRALARGLPTIRRDGGAVQAGPGPPRLRTRVRRTPQTRGRRWVGSMEHAHLTSRDSSDPLWHPGYRVGGHSRRPCGEGETFRDS